MNRRTIFIFILVILILVLLGYFKFFFKKQAVKPNLSAQPPIQSISIPESYKIRYPKESQDIVDLLTQVFISTTSAQIRVPDKFIPLAEKVAVATSSVTLDNQCSFTPPVIKSSLGNQVTFKNTDRISHTLVFNRKKYVVPAEGELKVPVSFTSSSAVFKYNCDIPFTFGLLYIP